MVCRGRHAQEPGSSLPLTRDLLERMRSSVVSVTSRKAGGCLFQSRCCCPSAVISSVAVSLEQERRGSCRAARTFREHVAVMIHPLSPVGILVRSGAGLRRARCQHLHWCATTLDCATETFRSYSDRSGQHVHSENALLVVVLLVFDFILRCF